MKNLSKPIVLIACFAIATISTKTVTAHPGSSVNFQVFYNELTPYGSWIDYPGYGYVWSPNVDHDFRPYGTNGYWVATEYGNTWVSDYSWGWAPFHYGRWMHDNYYGWLWMPGNEWAPAWVAWRSGGGYYGWAPLAPNLNISVSFDHVIPNNYWVFVPQQNICGPGVYNHFIRHNRVANIMHQTTIVNNMHHSHRYYTGPSVREIERAHGRAIHMHTISNSNRPGRTVVYNRSINIYRPHVEHNRRENIRPQHIVRHDDRKINHRDDHHAYNKHDLFENNQSRKPNYEAQKNHEQRMGNTNRYEHSNTRKRNAEPVQSTNDRERSAERQINLNKNSDQRKVQTHDHNVYRRQDETGNNRSRQQHVTQEYKQQPVNQRQKHNSNLTSNSNRNQQTIQSRTNNSQSRSRSAHERKR